MCSFLSEFVTFPCPHPPTVRPSVDWTVGIGLWGLRKAICPADGIAVLLLDNVFWRVALTLVRYAVGLQFHIVSIG